MPNIQIHPRRDLTYKFFAIKPQSECLLSFRVESPFRGCGFALLNLDADRWFVHSIRIASIEQLITVEPGKPLPFRILRERITMPVMNPGTEMLMTISNNLIVPIDLEIMLCGEYIEQTVVAPPPHMHDLPKNPFGTLPDDYKGHDDDDPENWSPIR